MKVQFPDDLEDRLTCAEYRARMIGASLEGMASSDRFTGNDTVELPASVLISMGYAAEELADEIESIRDKWIAESNAQYALKKK